MRAFVVAMVLLACSLGSALAQDTTPPAEKPQCVSEGDLLAQVGDQLITHHDLSGDGARAFAAAFNEWVKENGDPSIKPIPEREFASFTSAMVAEGQDQYTMFVQFFKVGCASGLIAMGKAHFAEVMHLIPGA